MFSRLILKGSQGPTRGFALQALASCSAAPRLGFAACGVNDVPVGTVALRNTNRSGLGSPLQFSHGFAAKPEVRLSPTPAISHGAATAQNRLAMMPLLVSLLKRARQIWILS